MMKQYLLTAITLVFLLLVIPEKSTAQNPLAFPGAEGYGRYTTGGRGGQVIEVTNLNNSGSGSLRAAISAYGPRTVVFRVAGTIALQSPLQINNDDITIAGQTAPGDGITLKNYPLLVSADNVIIRYIRARLGDQQAQTEGDAGDYDSFSGKNQSDIIIDHCSMSWSIDETSSWYDNENFTLQWCFITESLNNSHHVKGAHGYGGIWGGQGASFHHNLIAHHNSRNPRFNGSRYSGMPDAEIVDYRNNVIYNWGSNSVYGGEEGNQNVVANYYKAGPASGAEDRILDGGSDPAGHFYVADNFVYGFPAITENNWNGGVQNRNNLDLIRAYEPFPFAPVLSHDAKQAFELVLADAGAVLPNRDPIDVRIAEEVRTGTVTYGDDGIIDSQADVGGWPVLATGTPPEDIDHDGMADDWESTHGLSSSNPDDRNGDANGDGYTNLEEYLNSLTERSDYILSPTGLKITNSAATSISIQWKEDSFYETGFEIERATLPDSTFQLVYTTNPNDTSYTDTGLPSQTAYLYRVHAVTSTTSSINTKIKAASTLYADGRPIEPSISIPENGATDMDIGTNLTWDGDAGADSFRVYLGTNPDHLQLKATVTEQKYHPYGLPDSTHFYWRVDAVNTAGTTTGSVWEFTTENIPDELVGRWTFDEGDRLAPTILVDVSGNYNYGYIKNSSNLDWLVDRNGSDAMQFDGVDDYVSILNGEEYNFTYENFTLAFWLRQSNTIGEYPWVSRGDLVEESDSHWFDVRHHSDGQVEFSLNDGTNLTSLTTDDDPFVTGDWVFVAAVRNNLEEKLLLYADGVAVDSVDGTSHDISTYAQIYLGTDETKDEHFNGALDEINVYNYALSAAEIQELREQTITGIHDSNIPKSYTLDIANYPNPFNPSTVIQYEVPQKAHVDLRVYNLKGQEVANLVNMEKKPGRYSVAFGGTKFSSGMYIARISVGRESKLVKMMLIR